jgi:hypothetical protein
MRAGAILAQNSGGETMANDDPVALDRAFEAALNAGDLDALMRQPDGKWLFVMDMPFGTPAP